MNPDRKQAVHDCKILYNQLKKLTQKTMKGYSIESKIFELRQYWNITEKEYK